MWREELRRVGAPFRTPRLACYRGDTRTSCGVMPANNAAYCFDNNTIYFEQRQSNFRDGLERGPRACIPAL